MPDDIRREIEAADQAASDRRRAAVAAHQQALDRHDRSATADTAADVERTRAAAHAAHQAYTHDGRHITGRHDAAMLRWAAAIAAQREQAATQPGPGPDDSARAQANRAAVAANQAYRAGDLDQARQLTDQAAALDPSRAELWQQHRQQIAARRLILDARAAHADGDHQRAQHLLDQRPPARPPDASHLGRRPARTAPCPASPRQPAARHDAPEPGGPPTAAPGAQPGHRPRQHAAATPFPPAKTPSRPSGRHHHLAASQPLQAPDSRQADGQHSHRRHGRPLRHPANREHAPAASARTPMPALNPDDDPAARWPAPNPHAARQPPDQQARHEAQQDGNLAEAQQVSFAPQAEPGRTRTRTRPAAASADWRDQVLSQARQPWQPAPSWPGNPALHQPPEPGNPDAQAELSEPDASID